jgi:hypothetical protein
VSSDAYCGGTSPSGTSPGGTSPGGTGSYRAALALSVLRATRVGPLLVTAAAGTAIAVLPAVVGAELQLLDVVLVLRCSMVLTVLGAAFVLDDAARSLTAVLPLSYAHLTLLRSLLAGAVLAVAWAAQLLLAPLATSGPALPWAGLTLEPLTLLVWTLAVGAAGARRGGAGSGGAAASAGLLLLVVVLAMLPDELGLFTKPRTEYFAPSRWWWAGLLAVSPAAWAAALSGWPKRWR